MVSSPPRQLFVRGSCEVCPQPLATTGESSPPTSCLPVCFPNSRVHDVPTREREVEIWTGEDACDSKRPAPRVMASASAGELAASNDPASFAQLAQLSAIEDSISRCAEGTSGLRVRSEIAFVIVVRGRVTPATLSGVPPQLVGGTWAKRIRKHLLPCPVIP